MDRLKNFGFLLKDVSRLYVARFEQRASAISLTLNQCKALAELERNEGVSQARLAELTGVDPMAMVRILDRMESDRLIERRPDPADRRARRLYLTEEGKPLVAEVWRMAEQTRAELFAGIGKEDRLVFMRVLGQLHASAGRFEPLPPATPSSAVAAPGAAAEPESTATRAARNAPTASR